MPKKLEDRLEEELRRRSTSAAASAGLDRGRMEMEVLFLLPSEFVRMYRELFDRAFADPIRPTSDGGKDEGRVKAKAKGDPVRHVSANGAKSTSKRFREGTWPIRDEQALAAKQKLDRKLVRAAESAATEAIGAAAHERASVPAGSTGSTRQCGDCGAFQSAKWVRCPFHE
jgi:hypothetical protein